MKDICRTVVTAYSCVQLGGYKRCCGYVGKKSERKKTVVGPENFCVCLG